ncbi:hypothetical protein VNO78_04155 [Psophocarpus tetragonolobus]|uniref:Uncharacterized protein n=1 Tax=Psophocarpus tetragonolobus TaxID=3891 RepID=A0AAN9XWM9_PSOTE
MIPQTRLRILRIFDEVTNTFTTRRVNSEASGLSNDETSSFTANGERCVATTSELLPDRTTCYEPVMMSERRGEWRERVASGGDCTWTWESANHDYKYATMVYRSEALSFHAGYTFSIFVISKRVSLLITQYSLYYSWQREHS